MAREFGDTFLSWACKALLIWLLFIRQTSFANPIPISPIPHPHKWTNFQTCPAVWSSLVRSCPYLKWPAWAPPFFLLELVNSYLFLETASVSPCLWSSLTTLLPRQVEFFPPWPWNTWTFPCCSSTVGREDLFLFVFWFFGGFFGPCCVTCRILVPWPGIKPGPPAVEAWSPNHWTTREFPVFFESRLKFCFVRKPVRRQGPGALIIKLEVAGHKTGKQSSRSWNWWKVVKL